ncbi:MAG: GNAT family N-acetyltransferase [Candidatus Hodarchaeales archaeon]
MYYREFAADDGKIFSKLNMAIFPDDPWNHISFDEIRQTRQGYFLFSGDERTPAGYVILMKTSDNSGHLQRIGVVPSQRNRGFGRELMRIALEKFKESGMSDRITLYVERDNEIALRLYRKYGFKTFSSSWHFIAKWSTIGDKNPDYESVRVQDEHVDALCMEFSLEEYTLQRLINDPDRVPLLMRHSKTGELMGYCKFTPSFPGCMPFIIKNTGLFDTFARGIEPHALPEFDHVHFTFDDNKELASMMTDRGYELFQSLFKMELTKSSSD